MVKGRGLVPERREEVTGGCRKTQTRHGWIVEVEVDLYFKPGRKRLAEMMDVDHPESFSDDDIAVSVYMYMERLSEVIGLAL